MKTLLSFSLARKACVTLLTLLRSAENFFTAIVWCILSVRSRLDVWLENSKQDHDKDRDENSKGRHGHE